MTKFETRKVVSIITTYLMDGQYEQDIYNIYSKNYSDVLNAPLNGIPKLEYKRLQYLHPFFKISEEIGYIHQKYKRYPIYTTITYSHYIQKTYLQNLSF